MFHPDPSECDELVADLWQHQTAGILEEGEQLRAFFEDCTDIAPLLARYRAIQIRQESPSDTAEFPRQGWDPILVGERFFIAPSWVDELTPNGRFRLTIDATSAFGTGRHESTQLMLEAMERSIGPGQTVLDVGCGSGILSVAASMLGASHVFGCDIHVDAVRGAVFHLSASAFAGSVDAVRDHTADLVLMNISSKVIDALACDLRRITKPEGMILLAGFVRDNPPKTVTPVSERAQGEWLCWTCGPAQITACEHSVIQRHSDAWW